MKEAIIKLTSDHIKVKGGEYVRDIVRCKECKHWHEFIDAKGQGRCDAGAHNPFRMSIGVSYADFFCSYGEREGE